MAGGERTIRIKFTSSVADLLAGSAAARKAISALDERTKAHAKSLEGVGSATAAATARFAALAVKMAVLTSAVAVVHSLVVAVSTMAGIWPLLVAGGLGAAGAMAAVTLGADGAKKAFEGLNPTLDTLKSQVSGAFERSLLPGVTNLKTLLPQVSGGLRQIATAMGDAFSHVTAVLATSGAARQLNTVFGGMATIIRNIGAFLAPVIAAFIRIGSVAMPILAKMTAGFGAAGDRFRAFIDAAANDGRLEAWIRNAVAMFRQVGHAVAIAFGIVKDVIGGLMSSQLGGLGGGLTKILDTVRAFTGSQAGQAAIRSIGDALGKVSTAVRKLLDSGLKAIGPAIPPIADAFGTFATQLSSFLKPALDAVAPVIGAIAGFVKDNADWLGPMAIGIGLVVTAFKAWEIGAGLLNAVLKANPFVLIASVIIGLVTLIIAKWGTISAFFSELWEGIKSIFNAVIDWIVARWTDAVNGVKNVWNSVTGFFSGLWEGVKNVFNTVIDWINQRWNDAVGWVRNVWGGITGFFSGLWAGVRNGVANVAGWIRARFSDAGQWIKSVFGGVGNFLGGIWDGIGRGLKNALNWVIGRVNSLIHGINSLTGVVGIPKIPDIPRLARGGTATAGRSYLVGERGPELFTPGRTGRVTNTNTTTQAIGGGPSVLNLTLDLGEGIKQRLEIGLRENNRGIRRTVMAGGGAA